MYFWHIRIHRFHELISINFKVQISLNNTEIINTRNLNKVRIQNSQSAFELSIYWTLSTINVTRIVTGTLLWLIRILNKIHNSLICIVFNVFFVVFQEITSPFLLTGGIWSGIARSFKQNISEREWSVD